MPGTTPLQDVLGAFKAVLDGAGLGVSVHEEMPYEGAEQRSVVLSPVAGHTEKPAIDLRITSDTRGLEEHTRLQVSCFFDDQHSCRDLADKVSQALFDHAKELEHVYDIHDLKRVLGPIPGPSEPNTRESHIITDFDFYTHRVVT